MAQTPCVYRQDGDSLDYTPGSAVLAGTVVLKGNLVTIVPADIGAADKGAARTRGVFNVPKDNSDVSDGDVLYWDADGDPVGGTAGSGCFTKTSTSNKFAGHAIEAAGTGVGDVDMYLHSSDANLQAGFGPTSVASVAVGGNAIGNANAIDVGFTLVTGADDTAAIKLPEAAAGKICIVKNSVADKVLKVFPAVNDTINGASANSVYNQGNGTQRVYVAYNAVAWFVEGEASNP